MQVCQNSPINGIISFGFIVVDFKHGQTKASIVSTVRKKILFNRFSHISIAKQFIQLEKCVNIGDIIAVLHHIYGILNVVVKMTIFRSIF